MVFQEHKFKKGIFKITQRGGYLWTDLPFKSKINPFFKKYYLTRRLLFPFEHQIFLRMIHKKKFLNFFDLNLTTLSYINKEFNIKNSTFKEINIPINVNLIHKKKISIDRDIITKIDKFESTFILNEILKGQNYLN